MKKIIFVVCTILSSCTFNPPDFTYVHAGPFIVDDVESEYSDQFQCKYSNITRESFLDRCGKYNIGDTVTTCKTH